MPMKRQRGGDTPSHSTGTEEPAVVWCPSISRRPSGAVVPEEQREHHSTELSEAPSQMQAYQEADLVDQQQAQSSPRVAAQLAKRQQLVQAAEAPPSPAAAPLSQLTAGQGDSDVQQQVEQDRLAAVCLEELLLPGNAHRQAAHSSGTGSQQQEETTEQQQPQQQQSGQQTAPFWVAATTQPQQLAQADDGTWGSEDEEEEEGGWQEPRLQLPTTSHRGDPATSVAPEDPDQTMDSAQAAQQASTLSTGGWRQVSSSSSTLPSRPPPARSSVGAVGGGMATGSSRGLNAGMLAAAWSPWGSAPGGSGSGAAAVSSAGLPYGALMAARAQLGGIAAAPRSNMAAQPLLMGQQLQQPPPQQQQQQQQQQPHWRSMPGWQLPPGTLRLPLQQPQQLQQQPPQQPPLPPAQQPQQQGPWRSRRGNSRQRRQRDRAAGQPQQQQAGSQPTSPADAGVAWSPAPHGTPPPGAAPGSTGGTAVASGGGGTVNLSAIFSPGGRQYAGDAGDTGGVRMNLPMATGQQLQQLLAGIAALQQSPPVGRAQLGRRARRELAFSMSGAGQQQGNVRDGPVEEQDV